MVRCLRSWSPCLPEGATCAPAAGWLKNTSLLSHTCTAAKVTLRNLRFQGVDSGDAGALAVEMVRRALRHCLGQVKRRMLALVADLSNMHLVLCSISRHAGWPHGRALLRLCAQQGDAGRRSHAARPRLARRLRVLYLLGEQRAGWVPWQGLAATATQMLACACHDMLHSGHTKDQPSTAHRPMRAGNGGALFVASGEAALTNCTFTRNEGMYGGAIAMESSAVLNSGALPAKGACCLLFSPD